MKEERFSVFCDGEFCSKRIAWEYSETSALDVAWLAGWQRHNYTAGITGEFMTKDFCPDCAKNDTQ